MNELRHSVHVASKPKTSQVSIFPQCFIVTPRYHQHDSWRATEPITLRSSAVAFITVLRFKHKVCHYKCFTVAFTAAFAAASKLTNCIQIKFFFACPLKSRDEERSAPCKCKQWPRTVWVCGGTAAVCYNIWFSASWMQYSVMNYILKSCVSC